MSGSQSSKGRRHSGLGEETQRISRSSIENVQHVDADHMVRTDEENGREYVGITKMPHNVPSIRRLPHGLFHNSPLAIDRIIEDDVRTEAVAPIGVLRDTKRSAAKVPTADEFVKELNGVVGPKRHRYVPEHQVWVPYALEHEVHA